MCPTSPWWAWGEAVSASPLVTQGVLRHDHGLIDYLLNYNIAERPLLLLPIGLVYAAVYYVVFRLLIRRFDLMTPGREPDDDAEGSGASVPLDRAGGAAVSSDRR